MTILATSRRAFLKTACLLTGGALIGLGFGAYVLFLVLILCDLLRFEPLSVALAAMPFVALTHAWYGLRFLQGLTKKKLISSLGR